MTKGSRTILFFICLFLFLLFSPLVIFYTQGYRFDFEQKKFRQTGGFFFKVLPKQAEIYLDGKLAKKTDFFFGSALIENVLPKKYKVEIKKEGYYPWEKNLEAKEKEVAEAKTVVLFPENPAFNILTKGTQRFWLSPDKKNLILYEKEKEVWSLKLYDLEKNLKSHLLSERDIAAGGAELFSLDFLSAKEISLKVGAAERIRYFTLATDKAPPDLTEKNPPLPDKEDVLSYQKINNDIYFIDNFGDFFKTDGSFAAKQKLNSQPFPVQQETEYKLKLFNDNAFLQENKTLYQFNWQTKTFEKLSDEVKDAKPSSNLKKLLYFSDFEIWLLYLKDDPPRKKAGDKVFIVRLSEKITEAGWLNSDYLVFNAGKTLKISEVDERDKINIIDIGQFDNPPQENKFPTGQAQILWNEDRKELYVLSEGNLYQSEKLIK